MFDALADIVSVVHYVWTGVSVLLFSFLLIVTVLMLVRPVSSRLRSIGIFSSVALLGWGVLTLVTQLVVGGCPLTLIENELRAANNPYFVPMESFLVTACEQHLGWSVNPELITHLTILLLGVSVMFLFMSVFVARVVRRMGEHDQQDQTHQG